MVLVEYYHRVEAVHDFNDSALLAYYGKECDWFRQVLAVLGGRAFEFCGTFPQNSQPVQDVRGLFFTGAVMLVSACDGETVQ